MVVGSVSHTAARVMVWGIAAALAAALLVTPASAKGGKDSSASADSSQQIASRIVDSDIPVLVDFWAAWCMPCKMVDPIIKELEKQYRGKVLFLKVNIDVHRQIAGYFGVRSIPIVYLIKDKKVHAAVPGARPKEDYRAAIEKVLALPDAPDSTAASDGKEDASSPNKDGNKPESKGK